MSTKDKEQKPATKLTFNAIIDPHPAEKAIDVEQIETVQTPTAKEVATDANVIIKTEPISVQDCCKSQEDAEAATAQSHVEVYELCKALGASFVLGAAVGLVLHWAISSKKPAACALVAQSP
mmetsp:Transcript_29429/g.64480  ORF Transcript_29429/g.64480 Transcript_29429/m.64480 type:complete len:122 (-) Transcript_29429:1249-1614(-)